MNAAGSGVLLRALAGGLVAAVAGGVLWGWVVEWSGYEFGIEATAVGFLAGMAVRTAAGGRRGRLLQAVAVGAAVLGVLIGKYLSYAWIMEVIGENGEIVGVPALSREMFLYFRSDLGEVFSIFDVLWIGLAVAVPLGLLAPHQPEPVPERPPLTP